MDYANLGSYMLFLFLWMATPDTSFAVIVRSAIKYGVRGGMLTALGTVTCDAIFVTLTVIGFAEFLTTSPQILNILRKIGGVYILYISIDIIVSTFKKPKQEEEEGKLSKKPFKLFLTGFLINAGNPVVLGGIIAAVITFLDFNKGIGNTILYTAIVPFSTFYVTTIVAILFGNKITRKIITPYINWFERISGCIIFSLSMMILFA